MLFEFSNPYKLTPPQPKPEHHWTVIATWQEGSKEDGDVVYDYTEIYGLKRFMKGYQMVHAIFGTFQVYGSHIIHSSYNGDGQYGYDDDAYDSELRDDVQQLISGNVDFCF